ncbi:hypothetical protein M0802_014137 [Mischocyttarus mexicanus]|nr:hypothetical protein M0802_014601 [Mischocyttarus mexicanus]KAI4480718.1 hypothetical protein M0802_014137 [Mischocyttarus mexicanus]
MTEATMAAKAVPRVGLHATPVESLDILKGIARRGRSCTTKSRRRNTLPRDNNLNMEPPQASNKAGPEGKRKSTETGRNERVKRVKVVEDKENELRESDRGNKSRRGNIEGAKIIATNYNTMPVIDLLVDKDYVKNNDSLTKFLADSGATEHLTNSKLIFKTFDKTKADYIKCANKDVHANLSSEEAGTVDFKLDNDSLTND